MPKVLNIAILHIPAVVKEVAYNTLSKYTWQILLGGLSFILIVQRNSRLYLAVQCLKAVVLFPFILGLLMYLGAFNLGFWIAKKVCVLLNMLA
jgi:hypothetical protein